MENIIQTIAIWALPVIFAITVHEVAHGYIANRLGDKTALMLGRLTLNPVKHVDPVGTLLIPIMLLITTGGAFVFGWAKPVPVTTRNLRNPKRDMAIVAAAGPISNFLMAVCWALILKLGLTLAATKSNFAEPLILMGQAGIFINLVLGILNLIPIPPLDGAKVLSSFLPNKIEYAYNRLEPYGFIILIALMLSGIFGSIIRPPLQYFTRMLLTFIGAI